MTQRRHNLGIWLSIWAFDLRPRSASRSSSARAKNREPEPTLSLLRLPDWVREGLADYVAFENRESFEQLRDALGERPVDVPMMQAYGAYPRYRLLVTYFIEKKGWSVDEVLGTRLTFDEAVGIMRAGAMG